MTVDVAPLSAAKAEALRLIESEVGVLTNRVRRASVDHAKAIHPDLHAGSYAVLTFLVDQGGARAADMVARFGLDKGAVSRHLSHLEGLGLVVRSSDPADAGPRPWSRPTPRCEQSPPCAGTAARSSPASSRRGRSRSCETWPGS